MGVLQTICGVVMATLVASPAVAAEGTKVTPDMQAGRHLLEGYWDADPTQPGLDRYIAYGQCGYTSMFCSMLVTMPNANGQRTIEQVIGSLHPDGTPWGYVEGLPMNRGGTPGPKRSLRLKRDTLTIYDCVPPVPTNCASQTWVRVR